MKTTLPVIACLLATVACSAQWQLIDDFQQWEADQIYQDAEDIGWHATYPDETDRYWILADPYAAGNLTMFFEGDNIYPLGYFPVSIQRELPGGGIAPGETGTLFCRSLWMDKSGTPSWQFGTADKQLAYDEVTGFQVAPDFGDFNALIYTSQSQNIGHRDGGNHVSTNPPIVPNINQWYCFWLVVDNSWDMSTTPPTSTGVFTLYMQGPGIGDGINLALIPVGTDPPQDKASLSRAPTDDDGDPQSIIWLQFASARPLVMNYSPFLLDDFYFSQGKNLSDPRYGGGDPWGGYPIEPSGDIDTGDWLGWLNITQAPYIWSYALNGWIYMEEPAADAPGAWGYFFK